MSIRKDLKFCFPYSFSNDQWDEKTTRALDARLAAWPGDPSETAALVVGSGGLPYLLGKLPVSKIFVVDLSKKVLETTAQRIDDLSRYEDWDSYHEGTQRELSGGVHLLRRFSYRRERRTAERSGLAGDYATTKQRAQDIAIEYVRGDVRTVAGRIGEIAAQEGLKFAFINFSNVSDYMADGNGDMQRVLSELPTTSDTTITMSSFSSLMQPSLRTPQDHPIHLPSSTVA